MTTALAPCPNCGALNAESARFCSTCGTALTGGDAGARRETRKKPIAAKGKAEPADAGSKR
jgi:uncharacterized membrane protein YvbJ